MTISNFNLGNAYSKKSILGIIEDALAGRWDVYFINKKTGAPQPLTKVQLTGIAKFNRICIKLETGQTFEIGLDTDRTGPGTYQEVGMEDLIVNEKSWHEIDKKFGAG